jgi:hypothetical protein
VVGRPSGRAGGPPTAAGRGWEARLWASRPKQIDNRRKYIPDCPTRFRNAPVRPGYMLLISGAWPPHAVGGHHALQIGQVKRNGLGEQARAIPRDRVRSP